MIRSTLIRYNKNSKINTEKILSNLSVSFNNKNNNNKNLNNSFNNNDNNEFDNILKESKTTNNSNNTDGNDNDNDNNNNNNNNDNEEKIIIVEEEEKPKKLNSKERNILLRKQQKEKKKQQPLFNKEINIAQNNNIDNNNKNKEIIDKTLLLDKISKILPRCTGCGCTLQTNSPKELGYIPESVALKHIDSLNKVQDEQKKKNKKGCVEDQQEKVSILDVDVNDDGGEEYFNNFLGIQKKKQEKKICQRCYLLKNYGKVAPVSVPIDKFKSNLSKLKELNCVIVKVVDLMDFHGSFIEDFRDIVGNNPVIIVGNKMDLLPADIHKERIENWITSEAKSKGLANVSHVLLLSSTNKDGMKQFIIELEKIRRGRDVFIVGCSNVGKSTFVNALVDEYNSKVEFITKQQQEQREKNADTEDQKKPTNKKLTIQEQRELEREKLLRSIQSKITTSILPGTTLNLLSLPLWKDSTLFDTPGIDNPKQMLKLLTLEELKQVLPSKRIKPTLVHMIDGKTLFIGGMIRIDYTGPLSTFLIYTSNSIPIHLTATRKADKLFLRQQGRLLTPPILSNTKVDNDTNKDLNNTIIELNENENQLENNLSSEILNIMKKDDEQFNSNDYDIDEDEEIIIQKSKQSNKQEEEEEESNKKINRQSDEVLIDHGKLKNIFKLRRKDQQQDYGEQQLQSQQQNDNQEDELNFDEYNKHLSPLDLEKLNKFKLEQIKSFIIRSEKIDFKHTHCDLVLSGIGWISIKPLSKKLIPPKLLVHSPLNIDVSLRKQPLIPLTSSNINILK